MKVDPSGMIPRPIRDIVGTFFYLRNLDLISLRQAVSEAGPKGQESEQLLAAMGKQEYTNLLPIANNMIKATFRTVVAACGVFAVVQGGYSVPVAFVLGAVSSLPTTLVAVGAVVAYQGTALVITSLTTGILSQLGMGLSSVTLGYIVCEFYDFRYFEFGITEGLLQAITDSSSASLVKWIIGE
jgi:hypothetical protein